MFQGFGCPVFALFAHSFSRNRTHLRGERATLRRFAAAALRLVLPKERAPIVHARGMPVDVRHLRWTERTVHIA